MPPPLHGGKPLKNRKMEGELLPATLWSIAHLPRESTGGVQADERGQYKQTEQTESGHFPHSASAGIIMSLNKYDVWADLVYALDQLERPPERPPHDIHSRLTDAADLDAQPEEEFHNRLLQIGLLSVAYSKAIGRAESKIAHEAVEKGLKGLLIDGGLPMKEVRRGRNGHELHLLLADVQQHNPTAFNELERCFNSTIQYLESVTPLQHNTNIVDYFQVHGKAKVFEISRYESLEGRDNVTWGMIGQVYREIIRALISLLLGLTPKDIGARIEEKARKAILAASKLDQAWDAAEWVNQGPVRPRLEDIENLNNKVLYAAVRRCERDSRSSAIQHWARRLRRNHTTAKREARAKHRVGTSRFNRRPQQCLDARGRS